MPAKLSNLRDNSKNIRITFSKDEYIDVTCYPQRLNQDVLDRYREAAQDKDYDLAADVFSEVVTAWDLLGDDDEPLPINGDTFRFVSTDIMNEIWDRLNEAVTPKSQRRNGR